MIFSNWFRSHFVTPTTEELADLKAVCQSVAKTLQDAGYETPAFSLETRQLPKDFQKRLALMKDYDELLIEHRLEGSSLKNHKDLLWRFFSKMRYCPTSDIFDRIEDEDVIEVYDMGGDQIFRNLNYFGISSMSVEDLVSMNWKREFKRNAKVTLHLIDLLVRFATGFFHSTYDCAKIPVHSVQEMIAKRYLIELRFKYISPLRQNGKCVALIVLTRARRLKPV